MKSQKPEDTKKIFYVFSEWEKKIGHMQRTGNQIGTGLPYNNIRNQKNLK